MRNIGRIAVACVTAAFALGAGATAYGEAALFFAGPASARERLRAAGGESLSFGLSSYSQNLALDECRAVLTAPTTRLEPPEAVGAFARSCIRTAEAVRERSPSNAFAPFVAAYANALDGKPEEAAKGLDLSSRLGPSEGWLAELRMRPLREELLPIAAASETAMRDIGLLGTIASGRRWLSSWYRQTPEAQETILAAIETLPPEQQRSFLSAVKAGQN